MKPNDTPSGNTGSTSWQILGDLELPAGADMKDRISSWLAWLLEPLHLHPDLLVRLQKSAHDAATHALLAESGIGCEHLHLSVFAPRMSSSMGQSWGFYRLGKMEGLAAEGGEYNQAIEFYLYSEGGGVFTG